jgi:hypothetical protein
VPRLEEIYESYRDHGLEVIGLTTMSRNTTDEKFQAFLQEYGVTFPVAKVTEDAPSDLYPGGVPYAVIAKDATVVWSGHPGDLPRDAFDGLMAAK